MSQLSLPNLLCRLNRMNHYFQRKYHPIQMYRQNQLCRLSLM
jgi:hypothetical protein